MATLYDNLVSGTVGIKAAKEALIEAHDGLETKAEQPMKRAIRTIINDLRHYENELRRLRREVE